MAKAVLVSLLLVACAALPANGVETNVLNTNMLLGMATKTKDLTVDILSFVGSEAYKAVSPHSAPVEKMFWEQHAEGYKLYKIHGKEHVDKASKIAFDTYATAKTAATPVFTKAQEVVLQAWETVSMQGNALIDVAVAKLEKAHPTTKDATPKDFASRLLLITYLFFVIYVGLKVFFFVLRKFFAIFCCVFCCGACRKRNGAAAPKKNAPKKAAAPAPKKAGKK